MHQDLPPRPPMSMHSCAVARIESEQNSSNLRHYLNLYVLCNAGNGGMTAFLALTREIVDRCYAVALGMGGRSEGMPGLRSHYHPNYYGAYFRDPDGNKICVCCHVPASA
jgi:catechol 2,3-dioxygenase-like lactoylglutathione lyase family enzyme